MIEAISETNGKGFLLYAQSYPGAFGRGETERAASERLARDVAQWIRWESGQDTIAPIDTEVHIAYSIESACAVEDADSVALFPSEKLMLDMAEYTRLKLLCLKSARDFAALYRSIPQPKRALVKSRQTFYGKIPASSYEMLTHTNQTLAYYAAAIGLEHENDPDFVKNRLKLFALLESVTDFLRIEVCVAPDGELWTVRKLLRRLLWHDRIHARALYRHAVTFWARERIANPFLFDL